MSFNVNYAYGNNTGAKHTWPDKQKVASWIIFRYISVIFQIRKFKFGMNITCYNAIFFNMSMTLI